MSVLSFPTLFWSLLLAPFGLVLGSFANVLIHRLPQEEEADRDVVHKPSHCPKCKAPIRWYHNLPLLGWLWLWGKCADCKAPISFRYPLVELLAGCIFAASPWLFPVGTLIWAKGLICFYVLLVLFFTDFTEFILPDVLQFPMMLLGVLFTLPQIFWPEVTVKVNTGQEWSHFVCNVWHNGLQPSPLWTRLGASTDWADSLIGLAAGYGLPAGFNWTYVKVRNALVTRMGGEAIEAGLGMGDFKMLAWVGAFWGWGAMLGVLALGVFVMFCVALPMMVLRRSGSNSMLPLGCGFAVATPFIVFFGRDLFAYWMR